MIQTASSTHPRSAPLLCVFLIVALLFSTTAQANDPQHHFNIPSKPLPEALLAFSKVTNIAFLAPAGMLTAKRSKLLEGYYTAHEALTLMLSDSQIGFEFRDSSTIILQSRSSKAGASATNYERIAFNSPAYYLSNLGYFDATTQNIDAASSNIDEIFITGDTREYDKTKMSFSAQLMLETPGALDDPLWGFMDSPAVTFGSEPYGDIIIRGSSPDDHLFLIDGMHAAYLFHDFGDGILSKNTLHRFQLKPSAFGAEYGNAIGSIVDIGLRNPDRSKFRGTLDLSLIKAGIHLESPLGKRGSFYLDARYNTLHLIQNSFDDEADLAPQIDLVPKNFDYTSRYRFEQDTYAINLTVIGAQDIDKFEPNPLVTSDAFFKGENRNTFHTQAIALERHWDNGALFETVLSHTKLSRKKTYAIDRFEDYSQDSYYARSKFEITLQNHTLTAGLNYGREKGIYDYDTRLIFCDDYNGSCPSSDYEQRRRSDTVNDLQLYMQDYVFLSDTFSMELGLQYSRDFFLKKSFLEPRVGAFWQFSKDLKLYARAGRHHQRQNLRQLLNLRFTARAQAHDKASHYLVGAQMGLAGGLYVSAETYYKHQDVLLYATSSQERPVSGRVYGFELTIRKPPQGKGLSGAISAGYANSTRRDKNTGEKISYRYSRPFNATVSMKYIFGGGWNFAGAYHMQSGLLYTPLTGVSLHTDGYFLYEYGALYSERTAGYRRLDFRLEKRAQHSFGEITYHLDVINALQQTSPEAPRYGAPISDGQGGYQAPFHSDDGLPLIVSLGVSVSF